MTLTAVEYLCDYQRLGEGDSTVWMGEILTTAQAAGLVTRWGIVETYRGLFGIDLVSFKVTIPVDKLLAEGVGDHFAGAKMLLNGPIVPDTDVSVRLCLGVVS